VLQARCGSLSLAQVALFVNVRGKSGSYANIFLQGGKQMTWFAQPTQDAETPVIRRLLACRDLNAATPVVLFIREEGCPYIYAGRLTCNEYFPRASPLKLVWQLADFEVRNRHRVTAAAHERLTPKCRRCNQRRTMWSS
jgi:hypothetical protein